MGQKRAKHTGNRAPLSGSRGQHAATMRNTCHKPSQPIYHHHHHKYGVCIGVREGSLSRVCGMWGGFWVKKGGALATERVAPICWYQGPAAWLPSVQKRFGYAGGGFSPGGDGGVGCFVRVVRNAHGETGAFFRGQMRSSRNTPGQTPPKGRKAVAGAPAPYSRGCGWVSPGCPPAFFCPLRLPTGRVPLVKIKTQFLQDYSPQKTPPPQPTPRNPPQAKSGCEKSRERPRPKTQAAAHRASGAEAAPIKPKRETEASPASSLKPTPERREPTIRGHKIKFTPSLNNMWA